MNELARWLLNLPPQASSIARHLDFLHYAVIAATMLGATGVFAVELFFIIRFRRRSLAPTPKVQGSPKVEALVIGSILSLFLAFWVVGFRQYLQMQRIPDGAMEVFVTGKQWMWKFAYPGGQASVGVLYVPANRPVKLLMTSRDVIHSFYVPAFRVKKDVVPGTYTTTWFEAKEVGTFPIRCAEYCGTSHSRMLGDVVVLPPEQFEQWLAAPEGPVSAANPGSPDRSTSSFSDADRVPLVAQGERAAADAGCLRCHTLDGTPHIGPTWSGLFGREETLENGSKVKVDEMYLTESMVDPQAAIVAGFKPVMPSYQGKLDPADVGAIVQFIKTLRPVDARSAHPNPLPVAPP